MGFIDLITRRKDAKRNAQRLARILATAAGKERNEIPADSRMPAETGSHPRIGQART